MRPMLDLVSRASAEIPFSDNRARNSHTLENADSHGVLKSGGLGELWDEMNPHLQAMLEHV